MDGGGLCRFIDGLCSSCTGYGVIGACEDQDTCDLRSQFETNFLGTLNIIQLSLPYFREAAAKRKENENAGRYLIFSSTSGALGVPGSGPYCATKYATEGHRSSSDWGLSRVSFSHHRNFEVCHFCMLSCS